MVPEKRRSIGGGESAKAAAWRNNNVAIEVNGVFSINERLAAAVASKYNPWLA